MSYYGIKVQKNLTYVHVLATILEAAQSFFDAYRDQGLA